MITGRITKVKRVCGWLLIGIVVWNAVGIPWVLASEELPAPSPTPTPSVSLVPEATMAPSEEPSPIPSPNPSMSPTAVMAETGEAEAESVGITEVNTSVVGAGELAVALISPESSSSGITLPSLASESGAAALGESTIEINNEASVSAVVEATATSGEIAQVGEGTEMAGGATPSGQSGPAAATALNLTMVNTTLINSDLWVGVVKVREAWEGDLYIPVGSQPAEVSNNQIKLVINNTGDVVSNTTAIAKTGEIIQSNGGLSETGDSLAVASNVVLAGLTIVDSEVTAILIENLWLWSGMIYNWRGVGSVDNPQQVWLSQNYGSGCGETGGCGLGEVRINNEANVVSETVAVAETGKVEQLNQGAGVAKTGQATAIASSTTLVNTTLLNSKLRLVNLLLAAPWQGDLIFVYPEEQAEPTPSPVASPSQEQTGSNTRTEELEATETPRLKLSATHNAQGGIYGGDGVTYDVVIYNDGPITAHNVMLKQDFSAPEGTTLSSLTAKVGEIGVNKRRVVHFVLKTGLGALAGQYQTNTYAQGESDRGAKTSSNSVTNEFKILSRARVLAVTSTEVKPPEVEIVNVGDQVLGLSTTSACEGCLALPWYVAIWLGSLLYYGVCLKRKDWGSVMRWGSALPLTAYAGLWFSNVSCRNGLGMMPNNPWCDWFLLGAIGIYVANGILVKIGKNISNTNVPAMIYFRS